MCRNEQVGLCIGIGSVMDSAKAIAAEFIRSVGVPASLCGEGILLEDIETIADHTVEHGGDVKGTSHSFCLWAG